MARASNIYVVHLKGDPDEVLAVFTVKCESQYWAKTHHSLSTTERYRMRDGGSWAARNDASEKVPCPWEAE